MISSENLLGAGGGVTISPDTVRSESWTTFRIKITLGAGGLAVHDSLGLLCGSNIDRWHFQFASHIWGRYASFQTTDPAAPNYVTATCSRQEAPVELRVGEGGPLKVFQNEPDHIIQALESRYRYVLEISADEPLNEGDFIELTWGNRQNNCPGVQAPAIAMNYHFFPFKYSLLPKYDRELPFRRGEFDSMPIVRVTGQQATRLHMVAPGLAGKGTPFTLDIVAVDKYGNRDETFTGEIRLRSEQIPYLDGRVLRLTDSDRGKCRVDGIKALQAGWATISAASLDLEVRGESNAMLVSEHEPARKLFWGALHGHTLDCDGVLTPREHYEYARDVARLDFASCATHAEYFNGQKAWQNYLDAAEKARVPGEFVTFYGYEWAGEGHINGYFLNKEDAVNIYGRNILRGDHPDDDPEFRIPCATETEFLKTLKGQKGKRMAISHFHARYLDGIDDQILRLHEVYSAHQQNPLEKKYREILERGFTIGAVCGSDSHRLPVGHLCADPGSIWNQPVFIDGHKGSQSLQKKCGLQATFADERSPESIWEGMWQRHTYGTTGARITLLFTVNDCMMGDVCKAGPGERLELSIHAGGTANLYEVAVLKFDGRNWSEPFSIHDRLTRFCDATWQDQAVPNSLYFVRVVQMDGETAWSSPVWIAD